MGTPLKGEKQLKVGCHQMGDNCESVLLVNCKHIETQVQPVVDTLFRVQPQNI